MGTREHFTVEKMNKEHKEREEKEKKYYDEHGDLFCGKTDCQNFPYLNNEGDWVFSSTLCPCIHFKQTELYETE